MGGGLMQLVAYGAQDVYLTGNPQITFFKVVYRRHTNFAIECIECTFNGSPTVGQKAVVPITRNGDLVTKMYLKTQLTAADADTNQNLGRNPGFHLIDYVELQIGGSRIDKHYGHWLTVWADLTTPRSITKSFNLMVGNVGRTGGEISAPTAALSSTQLYVPLQFFCNRNDGLALPLIALQYHDVRLEFNFASASALYSQDNASAASASISNTVLMCDYIYLDSEERKRFAQASHEYLIEQVQYQSESVSGTSSRPRLNFNHPVKELIFASRSSSTFGDSHVDRIDTAQLKLNGHDRFQVQNGEYFNRVQTYACHTRAPRDGIYVYSFALKPEQHQPTGTCNFSRIDNAELDLTHATAPGQLDVYAVNYNVLRIMGGMGGMAYSN